MGCLGKATYTWVLPKTSQKEKNVPLRAYCPNIYTVTSCMSGCCCPVDSLSNSFSLLEATIVRNGKSTDIPKLFGPELANLNVIDKYALCHNKKIWLWVYFSALFLWWCCHLLITSINICTSLTCISFGFVWFSAKIANIWLRLVVSSYTPRQNVWSFLVCMV